MCNFNSQPREGGWLIINMSISEPNKFQLTAARRRLVNKSYDSKVLFAVFQLTAARRRLVAQYYKDYSCGLFQLTAARRRLDCISCWLSKLITISTHSRAKAAGLLSLFRNR